jgi:hypothetical protein
MLKWFLAVVALVAVVLFVRAQRNAVKVTYVNGLPAYNQLPNQEYIFQRNCYIFKLEDRETSYPLVASHELVPALPAEVTRDNVGKTINGARLLDIVQVGDRFRIVSVRREQSRRETFVTLEILLENDDTRPYPRLDAYYLLRQAPPNMEQAPVVIESHAVPRVKG